MNWEDYIAHEEQHRPRGALKVLRQLKSPQLDNRRDIYVYLPPSYEPEPERRFPVIYMHDGQNLFDPRTSFAGEWHVDGIIAETSDEGIEAIVVGIPNMGAQRCNEYSPFDDPKHGPAKGEQFLAFMTDTLKPIMDRDFRTEPASECTGTVGSSMGALIALYAFFQRPDVFDFAGVMSPALWYGERRIYDYLRERGKVGGRIYVDVGTQEGSDELQDVLRLRDTLLEVGYQHGEDMLFKIDLGGAHNEAAWHRRLKKQLRFLLTGLPTSP